MRKPKIKLMEIKNKNIKLGIIFAVTSFIIFSLITVLLRIGIADPKTGTLAYLALSLLMGFLIAVGIVEKKK